MQDGGFGSNSKYLLGDYLKLPLSVYYQIKTLWGGNYVGLGTWGCEIGWLNFRLLVKQEEKIF